jgi:hypothetical protein
MRAGRVPEVYKRKGLVLIQLEVRLLPSDFERFVHHKSDVVPLEKEGTKGRQPGKRQSNK